MSERSHFLSIRLSGGSVRPGHIPISQLLRLMTEFNKALQRVGRVLMGEVESVRKGPVERNIRDVIALDLVEVSHGSPATVLGLERACGQLSFEGLDFGQLIIEKCLAGLEAVQSEDAGMPAAFDSGVILALRDLGLVFEQGVSEIRFTLNRPAQPLVARYTETGYKRVQERIQGPQLNIRTIEGRLLMADFKEHGTRCRIHPSVGDSVMCFFIEDQKEEVYENILHFVRVSGEARQDPATGKITSIQLHDIRRLENREQERQDLLPQGTPLPTEFWQAPSLDTLAEIQGTQPVHDVSTLFGTWPGELDDGFEALIRDLRQHDIAGELRP
jgi:hypothetical protein